MSSEVTGKVIAAAIEVHRSLGRLLESTYEECLCHELALREVPFARQLVVPVEYKAPSWNADIASTSWWSPWLWRSRP
jgi:GxxExxY protein